MGDLMSLYAHLSDIDLAATLAQQAGHIVQALHADTPADQRAAIGKAGDAAANAYLIDALTAARPADGLLSEERACDGDRLAQTRVWIIDPIDGTREYAEGRPDWAVHVALAIDGIPTIGAVALPARAMVLRSDQSLPVSPVGAPLRIVVSRSRPPREAQALAETLGASLIPMGSAGAKAMAVVLSEADAYVHSGGQSEWDSCAPVAVALGHGLHCSRLDGTPLRYNCPNVSLPDLLICRSEIAAQLLHLLAGLR